MFANLYPFAIYFENVTFKEVESQFLYITTFIINLHKNNR